MTENYRKTVYCEVQFLKECLSQIDKDRCDDACLLKRRLWNSIENLLLSPDIKLFLDISDEDFSSEIKNIERRKLKAARKSISTQLGDFEELLWKLYYTQEESCLHLKCLGEKYVPLDRLKSSEDLNLNAIYLTSQDADICENISRTYGISVLTSKNLDVDKLLFEDSGCAIAKDEKKHNWVEILQGKCNTCNALIIVDNYILSDTNDFDENLREILNAVLPDALSVPFHLSVFTKDMKNESKTRQELLEKIVKDLRPNLKCSISLFRTEDFHDRTIITNNLWIGCGSGFNLFKKGKSKKMTVVNIVNPYLTDTVKWARKAYSNMVKEIERLMKSSKEYGYNNIDDGYSEFYMGDCENRMIPTTNKRI